MPIQNPHTFPEAASVQRNKSPTLSNSANICSTVSGVMSGRLYECAADQMRRGCASKVPFASASGIKLAYSARQLGGCTLASLSERQSPSPSTMRLEIRGSPSDEAAACLARWSFFGAITYRLIGQVPIEPSWESRTIRIAGQCPIMPFLF